jgi:hypothetical protein
MGCFETQIIPKAKRTPRILGFVDELTKKQAQQARAKVLELVNQGRILVTSQIKFGDVCRRFLEVRLPQLGVGAQSRYRSQIRNHIMPASGEMRIVDVADRCAIEA